MQRVLAVMGASLHVRLEVYEAHDDGLHLQALADPERCKRRLENAEAASSSAEALDWGNRPPSPANPRPLSP